MLWQKVGNGNLSLRNISGRVSQVQEDAPKCQNEVQSAKNVVPKCQNDTLELSMEELALLKVIKNNPAVLFLANILFGNYMISPLSSRHIKYAKKNFYLYLF